MDYRKPAPALFRLAGPFEDFVLNLPWLNIVLFLVTLVTMVIAGTYLSNYDFDMYRFWILFTSDKWMWLDGIPFAVALLAILGSHELGHYFLSRYHCVNCSLPYFLPGPNIVGTFGAVILMKSPMPDRRALFDIGAAGPLTGFVVATFCLVVGFMTADVQYFYPGQHLQGMVVFQPNLILGIFWKFWPLARPETMAPAFGMPPVGPILNSPFLDAACVGYLVTTLNLLPIGQLDGGHIAYSVLGKKSKWLAIAVLLMLAFFGAYLWFPWLFFAVFLFIIFGRKGFVHPPPYNPYVKLGWGRKLMAAVVLVVFVFIIAPVPVSIVDPASIPYLFSVK